MNRKLGITILAIATIGVVCLAAPEQQTKEPPVVSAPSGHIIQPDNPLLHQAMHEIALEQMKEMEDEDEVEANMPVDTEVDAEPEPTPEPEPGPTPESNRIYLGTYRISHYCPCRRCNGGYSTTASGADLQPNVSVAVDRNKIALGSTLYIDGYGERIAHDTGSAIKGERIDVCVDSHDEAYDLGVVYRDVYIVK